MTIRRAEHHDSSRIIELLGQVLFVHHTGRPDLFRAKGSKYTEAELAEIIDDDNRPIFVATDDADIVSGYAFCQFERCIGSTSRTDILTLYIDDICVDEAARGQHIGKTLYEYVVNFAREQGCHNVTLNVWTCNPGAVAFYEAMGMKPYRIGMETLL